MRILVLLSRVPYPLEKGDKLRAFHQIKRLSEKHEIILCCLNDKKLHPDAISQLKPFCKHLEIIQLNKFSIFLNLLLGLFRLRPLQVSYFHHKMAQKKFDRLIEIHLPKRIFCQLIRTTEYAKKYTFIIKTLDYMDALSKGAERRIENASFYMKPLLKVEAKRLAKYESEIFNHFEQKTIISAQDKKFIQHPNKEEITVIPNGVDTAFFRPMECEKKYNLVFTGNMSYPPNVESAIYIAKKIIPIIIKKFPEIKLLISGANPAMVIKMLQSKNITVSGWVDDIRQSYAAAKIFIAPMRTGTGLQNKLLEAMAMKIPC
ncbi:MAG: glycosyltransferase, partial [Flavobacteriales bacterium]